MKDVIFLVHCDPPRRESVLNGLSKIAGQNLFISRIEHGLIMVLLPEDQMPEILKINGVTAVEKTKQFIQR